MKQIKINQLNQIIDLSKMENIDIELNQYSISINGKEIQFRKPKWVIFIEYLFWFNFVFYGIFLFIEKQDVFIYTSSILGFVIFCYYMYNDVRKHA